MLRRSKPLRREKKKQKSLRRQRKTSLAKLKREADKLTGALVRARGSCESGRPEHVGPLQWAHGFSRRYLSTRWDLDNGFCLCAGCHVYFTMRPHEWEQWMQNKMGMDAYLRLQRKALAVTPIRAEDIQVRIRYATEGKEADSQAEQVDSGAGGPQEPA